MCMLACMCMRMCVFACTSKLGVICNFALLQLTHTHTHTRKQCIEYSIISIMDHSNAEPFGIFFFLHKFCLVLKKTLSSYPFKKKTQ